VDASGETVEGYLADMRKHRPRFLPRAFSVRRRIRWCGPRHHHPLQSGPLTAASAS